jgi:hypothetical protein
LLKGRPLGPLHWRARLCAALGGGVLSGGGNLKGLAFERRDGGRRSVTRANLIGVVRMTSGLNRITFANTIHGLDRGS